MESDQVQQDQIQNSSSRQGNMTNRQSMTKSLHNTDKRKSEKTQIEDLTVFEKKKTSPTKEPKGEEKASNKI